MAERLQLSLPFGDAPAVVGVAGGAGGGQGRPGTVGAGPLEWTAMQNEVGVAALVLGAIQAQAKGAARGVRSVRVRFGAFRATLYSFRMKADGQAQVRFHTIFRHAPDEVFREVAGLMLCRSRAARARLPRAAYDRFVKGIPAAAFELPGARRRTERAHVGPGRHHSLEESFERVNAAYFGGQLAMPRLCWSPLAARRILGSYEARRDRLIVSQVFDSPRVPLYVLDYLIYHELLHKHLGIGRRRDGRRCMHGREFRMWERRFERYAEAVAFLRRM